MKRKNLRTCAALISLSITIPMLGFIGRSESDLNNPSSTYPAVIDTTNETTVYSDFVTISDPESGEKSTISVEEYLIGVVAAEMPISFEPEALKAQTIAAHTYALQRYSNNNVFAGAEIPTNPSLFQAYCSIDEMQKKYGDSFETNYKKIKNAVDSVINQILTYNDEPIVAAFHSMSGGYTQSSENVWGGSLPYLIPVDSKTDEQQNTYITEKLIDCEAAKNILISAYPNLQLPDNPSEWFNITSRNSSDYVESVQIGNISLTGAEIRSLFALKSSNFTIEYKNENFLFTTKGSGHGVGMSQYGANEMAKEGKSYQEILTHYYPGTELTSI